jgi:hypothetical protein
MIETDPI